MKDKNLPPTLQMGMRSSVNVSSEVLGALLETPALHALLDSFSEALIVTDGEGRVRFLNLAAERINRLSKHQAVGLSDSEFYQRSALNYDDLQAALSRGGNSALTRSREGRALLSSTHAIPTGAYEKPFRMLTQKDFDGSQPQRRASSVARQPARGAARSARSPRQCPTPITSAIEHRRHRRARLPTSRSVITAWRAWRRQDRHCPAYPPCGRLG